MLIDIEKSDVRGFFERTLIEKEGLSEAEEIEWVLCGLPSFFGSYLRHIMVTTVV